MAKRPPKPRERIYVIQAGQHIKVGVSVNVYSRLKQLRAANPLINEPHFISYEVAEPYSVENAIHRKLRPWRVSREWFSCDPELAINALYSLVVPQDMML